MSYLEILKSEFKRTITEAIEYALYRKPGSKSGTIYEFLMLEGPYALS